MKKRKNRKAKALPPEIKYAVQAAEKEQPIDPAIQERALILAYERGWQDGIASVHNNVEQFATDATPAAQGWWARYFGG